MPIFLKKNPEGPSDLLDIDNPQLFGSMVGPESNEKIPNEDELHQPSGFVRLGVIPDLGRAFRKLGKKDNQSSLSGFGERDEKGSSLG